MFLRFLGTGTSFGVPVIGCPCATCHSDDPRDRRTRHGALLEAEDRRLLVDTPPELRIQLLHARVAEVDAVWYTHHHADHTHGVDDLRVFSMVSGRPVPAYGSAECVEEIRARFDYVFDHPAGPGGGVERPEGDLHVLSPYEEIGIAGFRLLPLPVPHGPIETYGFRVGDLGYITDAKELPIRTQDALAGVRILVLNALWFEIEHPTHFNVEEAVAVAETIGAEHTYLTHISHLASHRELERRLPPSVRPAYDGLVVEV